MTKLLIVTTSTIVVTVLFLFIRNFLLAFFLLSAAKGMFLKVTKNGIFENLKNYTFFKNCFSLLEFWYGASFTVKWKKIQQFFPYLLKSAKNE